MWVLTAAYSAMLGLAALSAQDNRRASEELKSALEAVANTQAALRCVVVTLPGERAQALTAVEIANKGDLSGLRAFVQAHHWSLETDPVDNKKFFLFSSGAIRAFEGLYRLEADVLSLLLSQGGVVDLTTNIDARNLLAEWMEAALSPGIPHLAQSRSFISSMLGMPFQEVLSKGLVRAELFGNVWLQYDIPGVEGHPMTMVDSLPFPARGETEAKPSTSQPSKSKRADLNLSGSTELVVLYSTGWGNEGYADALMTASEVLKNLSQKAKRTLDQVIQEARDLFRQSWVGPALEVWHDYSTLSNAAQRDLSERLQQMRSFFEAMRQSYPTGEGLPRDTRIYYTMEPVLFVTMQYGGRTLSVSIDMGQTDREAPFLRGVQFVSPK